MYLEERLLRVNAPVSGRVSMGLRRARVFLGTAKVVGSEWWKNSEMMMGRII